MKKVLAKAFKSLFKQWRILILCSWIFSSMVFAVAREIYAFDSIEEKIRFQKIVQEMRCLVCQNQNLADSNAPLAKDLRQVIYQRVSKGESETTIKSYLVSRYGEFILFKPSFRPLTYCLWLSPFILLLIISIIICTRSDVIVPLPIFKK